MGLKEIVDNYSSRRYSEGNRNSDQLPAKPSLRERLRLLSIDLKLRLQILKTSMRMKFLLFRRSRLRNRRLNSRRGDSGYKSLTILGKKFEFNSSVLIKWIAISGFVGVVLFTLLMGAMFAWYAKDLPRPDKIVRREGFSTKILDRNDQLLYEIFTDQNRTPVKLDDVSQDLINGTIAIEDKNFYDHQGFDPLGYARIVYNVLFKGRVIGGSTLTQQIVKNVLLTSDRKVSRKMKELVLAIQIEQKYNKDEILTIYLNEAPYGGTAWGVAAAAEMYFDKTPAELNLVESAILAGMPQSPSYYSPYGANPEAFKGRTTDVLRRMREDGYITELREREAIDDLDKVEFQARGAGMIEAPHFVMYVKSLLEERYGEALVQQGGLTVKTSLDLELHEEIQEIVADEISQVEDSHHITNGAVMVMDPSTGEILSMVGSKDYFDEEYDGKVNVTTSLRQPGSSIKPVTYAQAFREGFTPESVIMDVSTEFPGVSASEPYIPKNYSGKFVGPVTLRNALASSLNLPAVKILAMIGVEDMMQLGYEMGLTTFKPSQELVSRLGLSVTLGGGEVKLLELTNAYSTFANGGVKTEPISILEVKTREGNVLEEFKPQKGRQVLTEEEAFMMSHILSDNTARQITFGANSLLNVPGRTVAVKTGTTNDLRDNWAIGWTPQVVVGVWVGNNDNSRMESVASGVSGATPIWRRSIMAALNSKPAVEFEKPDGIVTISLDKISGYPSHDGFESKDALIIKGTQYTGEDPIHVKLKVCRDQNDRLAPDALVAKGEYDEKEFYVFREDDPLFGNADNHWQKGIDEWIATQEDERYRPPTEFCDVDVKLGISFESPGNHEKVDNDFEIRVRVGGSVDIEKIEFYANGKKIGEVKDRPYRMDVHLDDGAYELKAVAVGKDDQKAEAVRRIGVNKDWDWEPEPTPTPTPTPSPTPEPTPSPTPEPDDELEI